MSKRYSGKSLKTLKGPGLTKLNDKEYERY